ncbi:hypothetical protein SteCoe_302 [Stentor coeruleus]|uniref:Potassium channel domain-containing protein n=1 Tax=Stentor coeruleus TaxID=5963 RepID=A0A1R2D4D5_9CILI|nr:hypothetical protein SteCoe_302 [Stentor coeruleus]
MLGQSLIRTDTINMNANKSGEIFMLSGTEKHFDNWRSSELVAACFAFLGLVFAALDYEFYFSDSRTHNNCAQKSINETFRYLIVMCSFVAMVFLFFRHYVKTIWKDCLIMTEDGNPSASIIADVAKQYKNTSSIFKPNFFAEMFLMLILPYPGMRTHVTIPLWYQGNYINTCYDLSELFFCIMFLRLLFVLRAASNYTPFENFVARRYCHRYNVKTNMKFAFKCLMKSYPIIIVIFVIGIPSLIIFGCMVRIFERPLMDINLKEWDDPLNGIWYMFATMSTIGYGDYYPISYPGRAVAFFGYLIGGFIFALIMVSVQKEVSLNEGQAKAFNIVNLTESAVMVMQAFARYVVAKNKVGETPSTKGKYRSLKRAINHFKDKKLEIEDLRNQNDGENAQLQESVRIIKDELNEVHKKISLLSELAAKKKKPKKH